MSNLAKTFRDLHNPPSLLILPNAWDAGSARIFEDMGAKAIATTSAGVAWALGYPDGNALPVEKLVTVVASITDAIRVPLSVDARSCLSATFLYGNPMAPVTPSFFRLSVSLSPQHATPPEGGPPIAARRLASPPTRTPIRSDRRKRRMCHLPRLCLGSYHGAATVKSTALRHICEQQPITWALRSRSRHQNSSIGLTILSAPRSTKSRSSSGCRNTSAITQKGTTILSDVRNYYGLAKDFGQAGYFETERFPAPASPQAGLSV